MIHAIGGKVRLAGAIEAAGKLRHIAQKGLRAVFSLKLAPTRTEVKPDDCQSSKERAINDRLLRESRAR